MKTQNKTGGNSILIVLIIAALVSFGLFAYLQLNYTTAFVVQDVISAGTLITEDMLANGTIVMREIPKSLANDYLVTDFDEINNMYVRDSLKPGEIIFSYDIAKSGDLRNNEILTTYNLEAVTLKVDQVEGLSDSIGKGDKVNIYGIYEYDLSTIKDAYGGEAFPVSALSKDLQEIFVNNGYKLTDEITFDTVGVTKLLVQNVPVVDVNRDDFGSVSKVSIGVEPDQAESIYLSLKTTGTLGITVLPYNDGKYVEKETKGVITTLELSNKGTIQDVNSK